MKNKFKFSPVVDWSISRGGVQTIIITIIIITAILVAEALGKTNFPTTHSGGVHGAAEKETQT